MAEHGGLEIGGAFGLGIAILIGMAITGWFCIPDQDKLILAASDGPRFGGTAPYRRDYTITPWHWTSVPGVDTDYRPCKVVIAAVIESGRHTVCLVQLKDGGLYFSDNLPPDRDLDGDHHGDLYKEIEISAAYDYGEKQYARVQLFPP